MIAEVKFNGFFIAAGGSATAILGDLADLPPLAWAIILISVFASTAAGALARRGQIEARPGVTADQIARGRQWSMMIFAAQFILGLAITAKILGSGGNIWVAIPACVTIGWTGDWILDKFARATGMDPKGEQS